MITIWSFGRFVNYTKSGLSKDQTAVNLFDKYERMSFILSPYFYTVVETMGTLVATDDNNSSGTLFV